MSTIRQPNIEQSSDGSLAGKMRDVLHRHLMTVDDMLPARVVAYDPDTGLATVRPLVMAGTTDNQKIPRPDISGIKTLRMGAGGFFIHFPIQPGDRGWIKASDRDISLILQSSGGEDWPNTERLHSFSDALFIPDTFTGWTIDDPSVMTIQSMDGSVRIELKEGEISITAPKLTVTVPETDWIGDINMTGSLTATGGAAFSGGTLTHNGVNIGSDHTHSGVQAGGDDTGEPT